MFVKNITDVKKIYTILFLVIAFAKVNSAQWTFDPLSPSVFCDASGNQEKLVTLNDGEGGLFCFWLDDRTGNETTQIYGQRFDSNGNIIWEPNGKLILDSPGDIQKFQAFHYDDDKLVIVWYNNGAIPSLDNKLSVQQIDDDGEKVWDQDLEVSRVNTDEAVVVWYFVDFDLVRDDYGFHIGYLIANGGGYQYRLSRFSEDGNLTTPIHGVGFGGNYNSTIRMKGDDNNRVYLYRATGNGSEAPLVCILLDTLATPVNTNWTTWMTVTDAAGLSYSYDAIADEGGITFVWEGSGTIKTNRIDTTGAFIWETSPKILCTANGSEIDFEFKQNNGDYYAIWKDSRPGIIGNHAIYGQRFDINGMMQWGATGAEIANMATFNPFPKFTFDENNNLVVCHAATQGLGLRKHVISDEGIQIIGGNGEDALTGNVQPIESEFNLIQLDDHVILYGSDYDFSGNNIFLTCVDGCQITTTVENVSACFEYTYNGETYDESGTYVIELPGDTVVTLNLTISSPAASVTLSGDTLINDLTPGNYLWWNCDSQTLVTDGNYLFLPEETGNYALIIELNGCTDTTDCYFVDIVGVDNISFQNEISLFPNPGNDVVSISSTKSLNNANVDVYNSMGQLVLSTSHVNGQSVSIDVSHMNAGCYQVIIQNGVSHYEKRWFKN